MVAQAAGELETTRDLARVIERVLGNKALTCVDLLLTPHTGGTKFGESAKQPAQPKGTP